MKTNTRTRTIKEPTEEVEIHKTIKRLREKLAKKDIEIGTLRYKIIKLKFANLGTSAVAIAATGLAIVSLYI